MHLCCLVRKYEVFDLEVMIWQLFSRVQTSERIAALREQLEEQNVDAFFIGTKDSHLSEKTAEVDQRLKWITGFSGSGFAVVTRDKAAMWADGRYKWSISGHAVSY